MGVLTVASQQWRRQVVGVDRQVPVLQGVWRPYINLDNAATTPALVSVRDAVNAFLDWYASVHRGGGFKSRLSTEVYEAARTRIIEFVGGQGPERVAIFTKHTTEAVNLLAARYGFEPGDVVVITGLEHHANMLPWRNVAHVEYLPVDECGMVDFSGLDQLLDGYRGRVKLVAISAASNVTGFTSPIHDIAALAHRYGAEIMVDGAQLMAHRRINMLPLDDPRHIDYLAFSGHKMYAPYGTGVLIGNRQRFRLGTPYMKGGGVVKCVTFDGVEWEDELPSREEAGSPNAVGAVALAAAAKSLIEMGQDRLEAREAELDRYLLSRLRALPKVRILGNPEAMGDQRIGVVTLVVDGVASALAGAILGNEWGIGVRYGCFCAHPYLLELLNVSPAEIQEVRRSILRNDLLHAPAALRVSLGLYNVEEEVDALVSGLAAIVDGDYHGDYVYNPHTAEYELPGSDESFRWAFHI